MEDSRNSLHDPSSQAPSACSRDGWLKSLDVAGLGGKIVSQVHFGAHAKFQGEKSPSVYYLLRVHNPIPDWILGSLTYDFSRIIK